MIADVQSKESNKTTVRKIKIINDDGTNEIADCPDEDISLLNCPNDNENDSNLMTLQVPSNDNKLEIYMRCRVRFDQKQLHDSMIADAQSKESNKTKMHKIKIQHDDGTTEIANCLDE